MKNLNDCVRRLKYYSTSSVISFCYANSKIITEKGIRSDNTLFPWELETLMSLDVISNPKTQNDNINGTNDLINILNIIKQNGPRFKETHNVNGAYLYLSAVSMQQFEHQMNPAIFLYRYNYIFNHQLLKEEFIKKHGMEYKEYRNCIFLLYAVIKSKNGIVISELLSNLYINKKKVIDNLTIGIDDYKKELNIINKNINDIGTTISPLYKKPIFEIDEKLYIPLPNLLIRSITTSMLFDLTNGNDNLRNKLGTVFEDYTYYLLNSSTVFDEIQKEKDFKTTKGNIKTRDINTSIGDDYFLVECKSYTPKLEIRNVSEEVYLKEKDRLAEYIAKIYESVITHRSKYSEYNMFNKSNICLVDISRIYCALAVIDDPFINREDIYSKAANILKLTNDSHEYLWMIHHIKIMDYYTLEKIILFEQNPIDYIKGMDKYDYKNDSFEFDKCKNNEYLKFYDELRKEEVNYIESMQFNTYCN